MLPVFYSMFPGHKESSPPSFSYLYIPITTDNSRALGSHPHCNADQGIQGLAAFLLGYLLLHFEPLTKGSPRIRMDAGTL
jgi:hypothetical protein